VNGCFISEIFSSEIFYQDYLNYLEKFDEIMKIDNWKKVEKLVDFLMNCAKENTMHKLKNFKRLPWLQAWLDTSKVIAFDLLYANSWRKIHKVKKELKKK